MVLKGWRRCNPLGLGREILRGQKKKWAHWTETALLKKAQFGCQISLQILEVLCGLLKAPGSHVLQTVLSGVTQPAKTKYTTLQLRRACRPRQGIELNWNSLGREVAIKVMCEDSLWRSAGKLLFELICQFKWELESEMLNQTGGESSHTANEKQGENKSHPCKKRQKPVNSK